jgi:hypothetical protein
MSRSLNLAGEGSATLIAGKFLDSDGVEVLNKSSEINIFNAMNTSNSYSYNNKSKTGLLSQIPIVSQVLNAADGITGGLILKLADKISLGGTSELIAQDKQRVNTTQDSTAITKSTFNFTNNLTLTAINDLNIRSSNLKTESGDLNLTSGNNITAAQAHNSESRTESGRTTSTKSKTSSDLIATKSSSSEIESGGNIAITALNDVTIQAAKIKAGTSEEENP